MIRLIEDKIYYRCTNKSDKHISTGNNEWDNNLFVSTNLDLARAYGDSIEVIRALPDAKIAHEGKGQLSRIRLRRDEKYLDYLVRVLRHAKELGYDIIEFNRQGDVGTIIINQNAVERNYHD